MNYNASLRSNVLALIREMQAADESPTYDDLTFLCAAHRQTVANSLRELERRHILKIFRRYGLRNVYRVNGGARIGE